MTTATITYPLVRLGEIARPVSRPIPVEPGKPYRTLGVKWWGEGAYERQTIDGAETAAKTLSLVREGDLIINKIWVRHGSTAIVGPDVDGCAASGEFPTFELDRSRVLPAWLHWQTKTADFWAKCDVLSQGTSGKNHIKPDLFLTIEVPLPPLAEQRRVVARIEEVAAKVAEARRLRAEAVEEAEAMEASLSKCLAPEEHRVKLGDVTTIIDPNPSHRYPVYIEQGVPMISPINFHGRDDTSTANTKMVSVEFFEETLGKHNVCNGDVIFARKGKIGYARSCPKDKRIAMSHTLCVIQPNRAMLEPNYLLYYTRSSSFISYLMGTMNPNAGVPTLGLEVIRKASLPLPPLVEQRRIVAELDALQTRVEALRALQAETGAELGALLPAVLDRAFRGEL